MCIYYILAFILIGNAMVFEINEGQSVIYAYKTFLKNCGKSQDKTNFNTFQSTINISLIWRSIDSGLQSPHKLYKIQLFDFQFKKKDPSDLYFSDRDYTALDVPYYFHAYDNQISPIIFSYSETNNSINIKKGIASFYQITGHNMTERDTYHDCQSIYTINKQYLLKKRICHHPIFSKYSQDISLIPCCRTKSVTKYRYKMNSNLHYFDEVNALSFLRVVSYLDKDVLIFNCSTEQSLKFIKSAHLPPDQVIHANSLNDALLVLNPRYMEEFHGQTLKFDPESTLYEENMPNAALVYEIMMDEIHLGLAESNGNLSGLEYHINVTRLFKKLKYDDLVHLHELTLEKYPENLDTFIGALLSTRTSESENFILYHLLSTNMQHGSLNKEGTKLFHRLIMSLNVMGGDVNPKFVVALLDIIIESKPRDEEDINHYYLRHLIPTVGGLLFKLCKNHYLCRPKVAQNAMNGYYTFIISSMTEALSKAISAGNGYNALIPYIVSLTNVPTFYSACILTGLLQKLAGIGISAKNHDQGMDNVLTTITENLDTFECHNFRDVPPYLAPNYYGERRRANEFETTPNEILHVLNGIYLNESFKFLLPRLKIITILLRCDYSNLFLNEVAANLIARFGKLHDFEDYSHQYLTIKHLLIHPPYHRSTTYRERLYAQGILTTLLPNYMFSYSHGIYAPSLQNKIRSSLLYHASFYSDSQGIPENLDIQLMVKNSLPLRAILRTQGLSTFTNNLNLFSSILSSPNPGLEQTTSLSTKPYISLHMSVGRNSFLPITLVDSYSKLASMLTSTTERQVLFDVNLFIQDLEGTFCLPNGFPVYVNYIGALHGKIDLSLLSNLNKNYEFSLNNSFEYVAQSYTHLLGDNYEFNVTHVSRFAYTIKTFGQISDTNYNCMQVQPCMDYLLSNYTRAERNGMSDILVKSPVVLLGGNCEMILSPKINSPISC